MTINADMILHNIRIHSFSREHDFEKSIAIKDSLILLIDSDEVIRNYAGPTTRHLDLFGAWVYPGFIDSHIHLEHYARVSNYVACETPSMDTCLQRVANKVRTTPAGDWVLGHGWDQNIWGRFGNREILDDISTRHPIYLTSKSLHAGWANTAALSASGNFPEAILVNGGEIVVDEHQIPTGILLENALHLIDQAIPELSVEKTAEIIMRCQNSLWATGITGVHDFDRQRAFKALQILDRNGQLGLRVLKNLPDTMLDELSDTKQISGHGSDWLKTGSIKMFADGALGPHTAAMLAPYLNDSQNTGIPLLDADEIAAVGLKALSLGYSLAIHAIGDRANRQVLNGFELLSANHPSHLMPRLRHRIEHVQLLTSADLPRLASLNITASMQPIHAISDMTTASALWGDRCELSYAWNAILHSGADLIFGSDAPVDNPNPLWGIHAAITRRKVDGYPGPEGWISEQRVNIDQALKAYTTTPAAYAREVRQGIIANGAWADMTFFERNLYKISADELRDSLPILTISGGEIRHRV